MIIIEPQPGVVLARLSTSEFGDIPVPEKAHDSMTSGVIVAINPADKEHDYLIGRTAYWRKYKDDARITNVNKLVLIEIKDILGSAYDSDTRDLN